jgi:leucyl aminopeptidase (aminopeptidase T)
MNKDVVNTIVKKCLGYKDGEKFLIVSDDKLRKLAHSFYKITKSLGIKSVLVQMAPRRMHGEEPPKRIAAALKEADLAVLLTSMSLSHTKARKVASKKYGTRIASLPGITEEVLKRSILLDYPSLKKKVARVSRILTKGKKLEIHTNMGTHLSMSIKGRKGFADNGLYTKKSAFGNLPAGEACISPLEGTSNGRLVVDGSAPLAGKLKRPIEIIIKNGYAQNIPLPQMRSLVKSLGRRALNIAEFGIGLNPKARVTGNVLEDEKAEETAHIALGNNKSFGGRVSCASHLDFIFLKPAVLIDGARLKI